MIEELFTIAASGLIAYLVAGYRIGNKLSATKERLRFERRAQLIDELRNEITSPNFKLRDFLENPLYERLKQNITDDLHEMIVNGWEEETIVLSLPEDSVDTTADEFTWKDSSEDVRAKITDMISGKRRLLKAVHELEQKWHLV